MSSKWKSSTISINNLDNGNKTSASSNKKIKIIQTLKESKEKSKREKLPSFI